MAKPLKIGLIGTGGISRAHLPVYTDFPEEVKLTAVCDIFEDAARGFAEEAGVDDIYLDYETMLKEADIDAVDICTGHDTHAPIVIAAATAGKHALVEKPMGNNMQECRDMIAATDEAGVTLMIAHMLRFSPHTEAVRQLLADGELGTINAARVDIAMNAVASLREGHWMLDGNAGGGIGMTNTIHETDLVRYLIGDVKTVTAVRKSRSPRLLNNAEDMLCATLEFENGAVGTVLCLWNAARSPVSQGYTLFGSEGSLYSTPQLPIYRGDHFGPVAVSSAKRDTPETAPVNRREPGQREMKGLEDIMGHFVPLEPGNYGLPSDNCFTNEILHFAECCQEGKESISSGKAILGSMQLIFGIYEAARTGKAVDLASL